MWEDQDQFLCLLPPVGVLSLMEWEQRLTPARPGAAALSIGVRPFPLCTRFYSTQSRFPALLSRVQVRHCVCRIWDGVVTCKVS